MIGHDILNALALAQCRHAGCNCTPDIATITDPFDGYHYTDVHHDNDCHIFHNIKPGHRTHTELHLDKPD